jgi:hypothetical protein
VIAVTSKNHQRAVRYRQLALAEPDRASADLLLKLADEADRDVLCTSDWIRSNSPNGDTMRPAKQTVKHSYITAAHT